MRRGPTKKQQAAKMFRIWRDAGYGMQITAHTAHQISNGLVGTNNDHDTMINLSSVALRYIAKGGSQ